MALSAGMALAQSNVTAGALLGTVEDGDGGVLPGATVEARNPATGLTRRAITDARGTYRFDFLPVGTYEVRAELQGFQTGLRQGINVTLGSTVKLDFVLALGTVTEEIVVNAEAPVVETTQASVASAVSDEQIANLPLNGRDFMDFVALTPGVSTDEDQAIHVAGQRGIQNSFNIDGANAQSNFFGQERGTTRAPFTFSQGAIKEFQVIPSSYNVQFGNASGGVINAITKSGTNDLKVEAWYYMRNESMVGDDALGNESTDFDQKQFGAAVGGPVLRDRLHYFVSYDGQRKDYPVNRAFVNFGPEEAAAFEQKTGISVADELGNLLTTDDNDVFLGKLDWQISPNHLASVRYNNSDFDGANGTDTRYANTGRSNNGFENGDFFSAVGTLNSVLGASSFNELIVQYSDESRPRLANNTDIPEVQIRGYQATFGQRNYLPNDLIEKHNQIKDNFTFFAGAHTLKAGFDYDAVKYDNWFPRYASGQYQYSTWADFFADKVYSYTQSFYTNGGHAKFDVDYYAGYLQDEWQVRPNLTVTFGVRYDLQDNPTPEVSNPLYPATGQVPDDTDNYAPRVGFAWDPLADGRTVVRGGFGYFYDTTPMILLANGLLNNGVTGKRYYINCRSAVCPTFPNVLTSPEGLNADKPTIYVFDSDFEHSETMRASLGIEHQMWGDYSFGADLIYSDSDKLERVVDANLIPQDGTTPWGGGLYDYRQVYNSNFSSITQFTSDGWGEYWGLTLKARKRWADNWMFNASYTYSKAKDTNSNEATVSLGGYGSGEDPLDPGNDYSWSDSDVRHKFVASAVVQLPWGFQASGVINIRSGYPFTPGTDQCFNVVNGRCYDPSQVDYRAYYEGVHYDRNSFRQPYFRNIDLRLTKSFRIAGTFEAEVIAEAFNVLDSDNLRTTNTRMVKSDGTRDSNFGKLNQVSRSGPRQYQIGVKFRL